MTKDIQAQLDELKAKEKPNRQRSSTNKSIRARFEESNERAGLTTLGNDIKS